MDKGRALTGFMAIGRGGRAGEHRFDDEDIRFAAEHDLRLSPRCGERRRTPKIKPRRPARRDQLWTMRTVQDHELVEQTPLTGLRIYSYHKERDPFIGGILKGQGGLRDEDRGGDLRRQGKPGLRRQAVLQGGIYPPSW